MAEIRSPSLRLKSEGLAAETEKKRFGIIITTAKRVEKNNFLIL